MLGIFYPDIIYIALHYGRDYKEQEKIRSHSRYITDENTRNRYRFVIEQCKLRIKFKKEKEICCPVDDETKKEDSLWQ